MDNLQEKYSPPAPSSKVEILLSAFAHMAFFAMFYLQIFFTQNGKLTFQDLENQSIKVDMVALPDKTQKTLEPEVMSELKTQEAEQPKKVDSKETEFKKAEEKPLVADNSPVFLKKDKTKKEPVKAKQDKAIDRLKKQSALDRIKSELQKESLQKIKSQTIKGNQISKGNSLTGLSRLTAESYSQNVQRIIRSNWALPNYLRNKNLSTVVDLKIDNLGNVTSKEIYRSSGNSTFDDLVLATIERSTPLPKPADEISQYFFSQGYRIEFKE